MRPKRTVQKCTSSLGQLNRLLARTDYIRFDSIRFPSVKKYKGRNYTLSEVICICTCGMYLRVPEGSIWRLPSDQVGGVCVPNEFHVPGTQGISPGLFFCPSWAPAQCSCQVAGASSSQHLLSSFLLHRANYGSRRRMVRLNAVYHRCCRITTRFSVASLWGLYGILMVVCG